MSRTEEAQAMADTWEIRKGGKAVVSSPVKNCGYSDETLRQLQRAGYRLYLNGKPAAKSGKR